MIQQVRNIVIIILTLLVSVIYMGLAGRINNPFDSDQLGYYKYLPATFIYHHTIDQDIVPANNGVDDHTRICLTQQQDNRTPTGHVNNAYTYGVALMEAPFFFTAHAWDLASGGRGNGYSAPYLFAIRVSAVFFCLTALVVLYHILRRYYSSTITVITLAILFLGSNLLWFTLSQPGMSHSPLFLLYSLLLLLTIKMHEAPSPYRFALVGFVAGLITVIRPADGICLLIPLLYNVYNRPSLQAKAMFLKIHLKKIILAATCFMVPVIPQLLFWHASAGKWLYYSYGGQTFNWSQPKIIEGLLYAHNGWLAYCPVMLFAVVGMFFLKTIKIWALSMWVVLPLYAYIIYSWYCYNYINGYGSRPMIHMYPLLAISLAAFVSYVARTRWWLQCITGIVLSAFTFFNINWSLLQSKKMLLSEESSYAYNFNILGRLHMNYNDLVINDMGELQPAAASVRKIATLYRQNYQDSALSNNIGVDSSGNRYYKTGANEYPPHFYDFEFHHDSLKGAKWFKISGRFRYTDPPDFFKHLFVLFIENKKWVALRIENKTGVKEGYFLPHNMSLEQYLPGQWGEVSCFTRIPDDVPEGNKISLSCWNTGKREIYIDDITLELYQ